MRIICFVAFLSLFLYTSQFNPLQWVFNNFITHLILSTTCVYCAILSVFYVSSLMSSVYFRKKISTSGKCVLVTGCDSGFGHQTAIQLCDDGFTVFAGCLDSQSPECLKLKQRTQNPEKMHVVQFNVLKQQDLQDVSDIIDKHTQQTGDKLYSIVNNAGIGTFGPLEWGQISTLKEVLDVNTYAPIQITRHFIPQLVKCPSSRVILVSTASDMGALPIVSWYFLSKIAMQTYLDSLRQQVSLEPEKYNEMKIISIAPFAHRTNMLNLDSLVNTLTHLWNSTAESVKVDYGYHLFGGLTFFLRMWKLSSFTEWVFVTSDLSPVSRCISTSLTSLEPEQRYLVGGALSKIIYRIASRIPSEINTPAHQVVVRLTINLFWMLDRLQNILEPGKRKST